MRRVAALAMLALSLLLQVGGCARRMSIFHGSWSPAVSPTGRAGDVLSQSAERGMVEVDVSAVPASAELQAGLSRDGGGSYLELSARQCQCLAAANSTLANLGALDMPLASVSPGGRQTAAKVATVTSDLLALRALDERNRSAGQALELYYQLVEAEASRDALRRSLVEIDNLLANVESLRAKGLKVDVDVDDLRTRKIELLDKQAEARLSIDKINSGLRTMLGVRAGEPQRFWPSDELVVDAPPIDVGAAVAEGLATRADITLLRMLAATLSSDTLPAVQSALQSAGLAAQGRAVRGRLWTLLSRLITTAQESLEFATRSQQLSQLLADSERAAAEEIRSAAETAQSRLVQVALAKETLESRRHALEAAQKKRDLGTATPVDVVLARMKVIEAENEVVRRVAAWEIAMVKLKQSQGLLVVECGGNGGYGFGGYGSLGGAYGGAGGGCCPPQRFDAPREAIPTPSASPPPGPR